MKARALLFIVTIFCYQIALSDSEDAVIPLMLGEWTQMETHSVNLPGVV